MAYVPTTGTGTALAAKYRSYLKAWGDYAAANGQAGKLLVGEMGAPGSSAPYTDNNYDARFAPLMQQMFLEMNPYNMHFSQWATAEWNVGIKAFRNALGNNEAISYETTIGYPLTQSANQSYMNNGTQVMRGVNLSGADFTDGAGGNGALYGGTVGKQYYYPQAADFAAFKAVGINFIRFPFRWERMQPVLKGALDSAQISLMSTMLDNANTYGIKVLLDAHNYGRYDQNAATNSGVSTNDVIDLSQNVSSGKLASGNAAGSTLISCFNDFWSKMASTFQNKPALWGYGLTNEPHDFSGGLSYWQEASRQATEAIRLIDQTHYISVAGYAYSGLINWSQTNGSFWLTETIPAGQANAGLTRNNDPKIVWEGHMYFDYDGTYTGDGGSYTSVYNTAKNDGFADYANSNGNPPALNITTQTGTRLIAKSSFDDAGDFTPQTGTNGVNSYNSNTITLPYASLGNPGNSMRVQSSAKSDEGGVRLSLTAKLERNVRDISFDFYIPTTTTISTVDNFAIMHGWDNTYTNNIFEVRILGSGSGYVVQLTNPTGSYATVSGTTVLSKGAWNTIRVVLTDTSFKTYLNGGSTADTTMSGSYSGINVGGLAIGKFYGTATVSDMYFDNFSASMSGVTYDAGPNGGLIPNIIIINNDGTTTTTSPSGGTTTTTPSVSSTIPITLNSWYANGVKPNKTLTQLQTIARKRYDQFIAYTYETSTGVPSGAARIKVPDQTIGGLSGPNGTVSEGIGYGMLATAFFGNSNLPSGVYDSTAQTKFNALLKYYKNYEDANGLMNWEVNADGTLGTSSGGASDGDFDTAMSLIVAHRNWGSTGTVNYSQEATTLINAILAKEITPLSGQTYPNRYTNGDLWGFNSSNPYYTDYFAPGWFREFYNHTGNSRWLDIINTNYVSALGTFYNTGNSQYNQYGLITDLKADLSGPASSPATFGYNSVRYPWRIAADYVWNGSNTSSIGYGMLDRLVTQQKSRYSSTVSAQKAEPYVDYSQTGTYLNNTYVAAFGVGGIISSTHSQWAADTMDWLNADNSDSYFGDGVALMAVMLMAGIMQQGTSANGVVGTTGGTVTPTNHGLIGFF